MKEYICGGCTDCCVRFPRTVSDVNLLEVTHPEWFKVTGPCEEGPMGEMGLLVYVRCTKVIPGRGCSVHPTIIGREIRPEFCSLPEPPRCGGGTLIQIE